jgi:hypothetical protein
MGVDVSLLLTNNRPGLFTELRNSLFSEMRFVQTAQILWRNIVGIRGLQECIHFKLPIPGRCSEMMQWTLTALRLPQRGQKDD